MKLQLAYPKDFTKYNGEVGGLHYSFWMDELKHFKINDSEIEYLMFNLSDLKTNGFCPIVYDLIRLVKNEREITYKEKYNEF